MKQLSRAANSAVVLWAIAFFSFNLMAPAKASFDFKKGARRIGLGGASVALANTGEAMFANPAGLWLITQRQVSLFYARPFGLSELETGAGTYAEPTRIGNFGARLESFGFELYREMEAGITYANAYQSKLAYGFNLNFLRASIEGGGSAQTAGLDVGILFAPHRFVQTGFFATNINGPRLGRTGEALPRSMTIGLAFMPAQSVLFSIEAFKDVRFETSVRSGAEYRPVQPVVFRFGWATNPDMVSGGVGLSLGTATIDYAFDIHPVLGTTHYVQLSVTVGKKGQDSNIPERTLRSSPKQKTSSD